MSDSCDTGLEVTFGSIFYEVVSHPRKVGTSFEFLVAAIEKAVVPLVEDFVSLVEVNHYIINLRQIKVIHRQRSRFMQMSLVDGLTHEV